MGVCCLCFNGGGGSFANATGPARRDRGAKRAMQRERERERTRKDDAEVHSTKRDKKGEIEKLRGLKNVAM